MSGLVSVERPAEGDAAGLLVLHHGRGTSELDLLPLADALDPGRRLHVVSPRGPLTLDGMPGHHWYQPQRVGYPDPITFFAGRDALAEFHDSLWQRTGIGPERTVLGGFSMGSVMSFALGLDSGRPAPAGILGFSGFVPQVDGWMPDTAGRQNLGVFIAHGSHDQVISVEFGRNARDFLEAGGLSVEYHEPATIHTIDPATIEPASRWLAARLAGEY